MAKKAAAAKKSAKKAGRRGRRRGRPPLSSNPLLALEREMKALEKKRTKVLGAMVARKKGELSKAQAALEDAAKQVDQLTAELAGLQGGAAEAPARRRGRPKGSKSAKKAAKKAGKRGRPKGSKSAKKAAKKAGKRGRPKGSKSAKKAAKRGRPKGSKSAKKAAAGGKRGRKPRVSLEIKQAAVANALKKHPSGVAWADLHKELAGVKDSKVGLVFSAPDFNSVQVFGKRLLPAGWKVEGKRREARIVKK